MRSRNMTFVLGLIWFLFSTTTALPGAQLDLKSGEWEIRVEMEMAGMPFPMPSTTVKQCLTAEDPVPNPKSENQDCTYTELEISGNTAKWKMECKMDDGQTMQGEGEVTYKGTTMSGKQTISGAEGITIESTYNGKWIGPCKE